MDLLMCRPPDKGSRSFDLRRAPTVSGRRRAHCQDRGRERCHDSSRCAATNWPQRRLTRKTERGG